MLNRLKACAVNMHVILFMLQGPFQRGGAAPPAGAQRGHTQRGADLGAEKRGRQQGAAGCSCVRCSCVLYVK